LDECRDIANRRHIINPPVIIITPGMGVSAALCRGGPVGMVINFIDLIGHIRVSLFARQGDDAGKPTRGLYFADHNAKLPAYQFALYDEMVWS
jgi:hypothetical protein